MRSLRIWLVKVLITLDLQLGAWLWSYGRTSAWRCTFQPQMKVSTPILVTPQDFVRWGCHQQGSDPVLAAPDGYNLGFVRALVGEEL